MGLKLKPIVKVLDSQKEFWSEFVSIIQSVLPFKRRLTPMELNVFSYVLSKDMNKDHFRGKYKDETMADLRLNIHNLGMHRSNIAKKGWIIDKLPERFIRNMQKEIKPVIDEADGGMVEVELTFILRFNAGTREEGS